MEKTPHSLQGLASQLAQTWAHRHGASIEELALPLARCTWAWIAILQGSTGGKPPLEQRPMRPLEGSSLSVTTAHSPALPAPQPWKAFHNPCPEQDD